MYMTGSFKISTFKCAKSQSKYIYLKIYLPKKISAQPFLPLQNHLAFYSENDMPPSVFYIYFLSLADSYMLICQCQIMLVYLAYLLVLPYVFAI